MFILKKNKSDYIFLFFIYVIVLSGGISAFYPFFYTFLVSISDSVQFFKKGVTVFPVGFSLDAYRVVFAGTDLWRALINTTFITVVGTFLGVVIILFASYAISKRRLVGRKFFIFYIIITMYFSGGLIPGYILIMKLHLYNTFWSVILPGVVSTYYIILARTFFDSLPVEIEESACIDGANEFRILFSIILPLCKPIIAVIGLYFGVGFWNTYFNAILYMPKAELDPIQVYLAKVIIANSAVKEIGLMGPDAGRNEMISHQLKYALIIVGILPIMAVYPFIQKYFVKGMLIGSLKG